MYSSDLNGYSSEEWNDGFTNGQRNRKEQVQQELSVYGYHGEYADSDEDILTLNDTDDDGENRRNVDKGITTAVKNHAIWNGFNIRFLKSSEQKVEVICKKDCPWRIYASWDGRKEHFVVKTLNDIHTFKRLYICFDSLARGFLEGCRRVIGLDGCFLKTKMRGQLLCAVGKDGNNQMYPIAWAVVEGENQASWTWFIQLLMGDLGIYGGNGWTIMSDQQKCMTHQDFNRIMQQMTTLKPQAAHDFGNIGVKKFCRAYISEMPKCEVIDNNVCECFNSYILQYRSKYIIDMLEDIRSTIMQRIVKKRELVSDITDQLCPRIRELLEGNKLKSRTCTLRHAGEYQFEVTDLGNRFVVDLRTRSCSCRYWNIRGIPCSHAITCIH
ncbi:uncharacterized protein LOC144714836 [Wolffia australiana]